MSTLRERVAKIVADRLTWGLFPLQPDIRDYAAADRILALPEIATALERQGEEPNEYWCTHCGRISHPISPARYMGTLPQGER